MATTFVQKIKNYLQLPKLSTAERDTYEQIRQAICQNPQALSQITEKINPLGNFYDAAYCLDSDIKLVVAQHSHATEVLLPFKPHAAYPQIAGYKCYVIMPNGTVVNLNDTKRAKLLLKTARDKGKVYNNKIVTNTPHGIYDYINTFKEKYITR